MALEKDTITASCLRPGFLPELGHQVVFLGLGRMQHGARQPMGQIMSGVHVCLGDETCKNMYDSIPPNRLLFFLPPSNPMGACWGWKMLTKTKWVWLKMLNLTHPFPMTFNLFDNDCELWQTAKHQSPQTRLVKQVWTGIWWNSINVKLVWFRYDVVSTDGIKHIGCFAHIFLKFQTCLT